MKVGIAFRREGKNFSKDKVCSAIVEIPDSILKKDHSQEDLIVILNYIEEKSLASKGTHRSGIFEVQTDLGVWNQKDDNKINTSRLHDVNYLTWEQWEKE